MSFIISSEHCLNTSWIRLPQRKPLAWNLVNKVNLMMVRVEEVTRESTQWFKWAQLHQYSSSPPVRRNKSTIKIQWPDLINCAHEAEVFNVILVVVSLRRSNLYDIMIVMVLSTERHQPLLGKFFFWLSDTSIILSYGFSYCEITDIGYKQRDHDLISATQNQIEFFLKASKSKSNTILAIYVHGYVAGRQGEQGHNPAIWLFLQFWWGSGSK